MGLLSRRRFLSSSAATACTDCAHRCVVAGRRKAFSAPGSNLPGPSFPPTLPGQRSMADFLTEFRYRGIDNSDGGAVEKFGHPFRARVKAWEDIGHSGLILPSAHGSGSEHAHPPTLPRERTTAGFTDADRFIFPSQQRGRCRRGTSAIVPEPS